MDRLVRGLSRFKEQVYWKEHDLFQELALGQRPEALFITCADSRIDPCLLTQTKPGELFICRVVGNIVPPYPTAIGGVSATVEYAAAVLRVKDIIVCGHTDCGVMKGVMNPDVLDSLPNISSWLNYARPAMGLAAKSTGAPAGPEFLLAMTERNVVLQLKNLRSHPAVAARLEQGDLGLHGWVYDIASGDVTAYDNLTDRFTTQALVHAR